MLLTWGRPPAPAALRIGAPPPRPTARPSPCPPHLQGPEWQGDWHLWLPQARRRPQTWSQGGQSPAQQRLRGGKVGGA